MLFRLASENSSELRRCASWSKWCRMLFRLASENSSELRRCASTSSDSPSSFGWQHTKQKHMNRKHGAGSKADVSDFSGNVSSKSWKLLMAFTGPVFSSSPSLPVDVQAADE